MNANNPEIYIKHFLKFLLILRMNINSKSLKEFRSNNLTAKSKE